MSHDAAYAQEEFSLLDLLILLARYKKFIIAFPVAAMVLTLVWSLLQSDQYTATARLLPPPQPQFSSMGLASALGVTAGGHVIVGGKGAAELYVDVLKSNNVLDALIGRFDLKALYDTDSQEEAREMLQSRTTITSGKDSFIAITVRDTGRERATALVNAYIGELNRLMRQAAVQTAAQQQAFLLHELAGAQKNVAAAEQALQQQMAQHGMTSATDNVEAVARTIGLLRAQISEQQVNLNATNSFLSARNPSYLRAQQELDSLKLELDRLSEGRATGDGAGAQPENAAMAAQLVRNLANARRAFESISVQHDLAKMDSSESILTTQVLDDAILPDAPLVPERVRNVLLAGLAAAILAIAICFVAEAMRVMKMPARDAGPADNLFS